MAKPFLFYALVKGYWASGGFRIIGVTSEKGRKVYGRDEADATTNVADRDVLHRFPPGTDPAFCLAARDRANRAAERLQGSVAHAEAEAYRLRRERDAAILEAAKGTTDG